MTFTQDVKHGLGSAMYHEAGLSNLAVHPKALPVLEGFENTWTLNY